MEIVRYLLTAMEKKNTFVLLAIAGIQSILDLLGIALIFPFIKVALKPELIFSFFIQKNIFLFQDVTDEQMVFIVGIALIFLYILKIIIQAKLIRIQSEYMADFTARNTNKIIDRILHARYKVFQEIAVSEIVGTAYSNTVHATLALAALVQLFNEALILTLLFVSLLYFQPLIAISLSIFVLLIGYLLYQKVAKPLHFIGIKQSQIENTRYRLLFSIASAIRDIKVMGLEELFVSKNRHVSASYAELASKHAYKASLPRLIIEFLALATLVFTALIIVLFDIPLESAGPALGVLAVAAIRVVPSISKLFNSLGSFRSSSPFCSRLIELQNKLGTNKVLQRNDQLSFNQLIELKNVSFSYEDNKVLNKVCLKLKRGESIGIVGLSGAGKTTLLDVFTGLQQATSGEFFCDNKKYDPFGSKSIHNMIGYVSQSITLLDDSIAFNVSFDEYPDETKVLRVLTMANLQDLIRGLPDGIFTRVGENGLRLSGGQRQRIGIARALYRDPEVLIFDEATSALDTISEKELTIEIEKLRGTVSTVIVAHRLSTVMACDRIYVLSNGEVDSVGTHSELIQKSDFYNKLNTVQQNATFT